MEVVRNVKYGLFLIILVLVYACKTDPTSVEMLF